MKRLFTLVVVFCFVAASHAQKIGETTKAEGPDSCNKPGRYVVYMQSQIRADQYLIDTCLGRIWQQVTYTDLDGQTVWKRVPRLDSQEELSIWATQELIEKESQQ